MKAYQPPAAGASGKSWKWLRLGAIGMATLFPLISFSQGSAIHSTEILANIDHSTARSEVNSVIRVIKGKVVDDTKAPLPGVNVVLRGTTIGTVTDINGEFLLNADVKKGDVLIFSFIGFVTEEYKISENDAPVINMNMIAMSCDLMGEVAVEEVYTSKKSLWSKVKYLFR